MLGFFASLSAAILSLIQSLVRPRHPHRAGHIQPQETVLFLWRAPVSLCHLPVALQSQHA